MTHRSAADLALALARDLDRDLDRTRARDLDRELDRAHSRAHTLGRSLTEQWAADTGRVPRNLVALVVRMLPEHDRQRVWEELCAELAELPPEKRLGHARRALACAWDLRCALTETVRTSDGAPAHRAKQ